MLTKISEFYKEEVDAAVDALTSVIEPIMILFLGGFIGGLLVCDVFADFQYDGSHQVGP